MNRIKLTLTAIAFGGALSMTSTNAHALGPVDLEVGAKAGIGTNPSDGTINPLGFGIGARAGVAIKDIYAGLNVMYYLGGSDTVLGADVSAHALQYGLEGGYGFHLIEILTIRPQLGLGNISFTSKAEGSGLTFEDTKGYLYLEPGVVALVSLGGLFVGADANLLVIPGVEERSGTTTESKTYTAFTLHGQVGFKF
jgi:hypothetical protein